MDNLTVKKAKLLDISIKETQLERFVNECSEVIDNPLVLLDNTYKVLAHSSANQILDPYWQENVEQGYCNFDFVLKVNQLNDLADNSQKKEPFIIHCEECQEAQSCQDTKLIFRLMNKDNRIGSLVLLDSLHSLTEDDKELLKIIGKMIQKKLIVEEFSVMTNSASDQLVADLIQGKILDEKELVGRLHYVDFERNSAYRVISMNMGKYAASKNKAKSYSNQIQHTLQYNWNVLATFIESEIMTVLLHESDYQKVKQSFCNEAYQAGVSLGASLLFDDLLQTNEAYVESISSLTYYEEAIPRKRLVEYSDIQLFCLLPKNLNLLVAIQRYVQPSINVLLRYDYENHTDLFSTLFVYILQNENINNTAKCLYLHRNTIRYKISKITELCRIDLTSFVVLSQLFASYQILFHYLKENQQNKKIIDQLADYYSVAYEYMANDFDSICASCTFSECEFVR